MQKFDDLVCYKVDVAGVMATPNVCFSLHIGSSLSWQVYYCDVEVLQQQCPLLCDLTTSLASDSDLVKITCLLSLATVLFL